jgi:hypothetical protein
MRIVFTLLFLASAGTRAQANQILDLANQADVIVLGDAISVSQAGPYTAAYKVRADFVLKGSEPVGSIISTTLSDIGKGMVSDDDSVHIPSPLEEMHGLWFLKQASHGYVSVPREMRVFGIEGALVRLPKFWTAQTGVELERQLFSAALESRRHSLSSDELIRRREDMFGEKLAVNSLLYAERFGFRDLALEFVDELLTSPSNEERNFGHAHRGRDDARSRTRPAGNGSGVGPPEPAHYGAHPVHSGEWLRAARRSGPSAARQACPQGSEGAGTRTGASARPGGPRVQIKGDATAGKEAARQPGS